MSKPTILLVEDQPEILALTTQLLERAGCEVLAARTGGEGMCLLLRGGFDLAILSINLPGIGGFEICRRMKQDPRLRHVPVIFISGRLSELDRWYSMELGAAGYIDKPFDKSVFVRQVMCCIKLAKDSSDKFGGDTGDKPDG